MTNQPDPHIPADRPEPDLTALRDQLAARAEAMPPDHPDRAAILRSLDAFDRATALGRAILDDQG